MGKGLCELELIASAIALKNDWVEDGSEKADLSWGRRSAKGGEGRGSHEEEEGLTYGLYGLSDCSRSDLGWYTLSPQPGAGACCSGDASCSESVSLSDSLSRSRSGSDP